MIFDGHQVPARHRAGARVARKGGSAAAFFKPRGQGLAADAEDAAHAALGAALVVGGQHLCAKPLWIGTGAGGTGAGGVAAALAALMAEVLLLAAGGFAVAREAGAAAVRTKDRLSDHAESVPETFQTRPLPYGSTRSTPMLRAPPCITARMTPTTTSGRVMVIGSQTTAR